jgi:hypothetical protein
MTLVAHLDGFLGFLRIEENLIDIYHFVSPLLYPIKGAALAKPSGGGKILCTDF